MQQLYLIEAEIRELPPSERLAARRSRSRPIVRSLRRYFQAQLKKMSPRSDMAKAISYAFRRWPAFVRFLFNGQLEIDNLIAERAIRGVTVGRRNWLFAGSIGGGERAAKILSVIETCKAYGIEPDAYLRRHAAHRHFHQRALLLVRSVAPRLGSVRCGNWARRSKIYRPIRALELDDRVAPCVLTS